MDQNLNQQPPRSQRSIEAFQSALYRGLPIDVLVSLVREFADTDDDDDDDDDDHFWHQTRDEPMDVGNGSLLWRLFIPENEDNQEEELNQLIDYCFDQLSPSRQVEFFRALMDSIPDFLVTTNPDELNETFLHKALFHKARLDVVQLLAQNPGVTRLQAYENNDTPLNFACHSACDPNIIHFLLDMDRDALRVPDTLGRLPLHWALARRDEYDIHTRIVPRMVWLYPEALYAKTAFGYTPVMFALWRSATPISWQFCIVAMQLIQQAPDSVRFFTRKGCNALLCACCHCPHVQGIRKLIDLYPIALTLVGMEGYGVEWYESLLPADAAREALSRQLVSPEVKELVDKETMEMFLAAIEILFHDTAHHHHGTTSIKEHVQNQICSELPGINLNASSFSIAQSMRQDHGGVPVELCTALFHYKPMQDLVRHNPQFRNMVCGAYRMNKMNRAYGKGSAALSQLRVLECVVDNLDCIFLHLRESTELFARTHH